MIGDFRDLKDKEDDLGEVNREVKGKRKGGFVEMEVWKESRLLILFICLLQPLCL